MKRICFVAPALLTVLLISSCADSGSQGNAEAKKETESTMEPAEAKPSFASVELTYKNDPTCGMPVKPENIADTAHYQGGIIGFCAKECKEQFRANEKTLAAKLQPK